MKKSGIARQRGFTLIEIMIVVLIIALMMGLGVAVLFPGNEAKLRDQSAKLAGTIKFLYNEAAIKNRYYRIAFDLDGLRRSALERQGAGHAPAHRLGQAGLEREDAQGEAASEEEDHTPVDPRGVVPGEGAGSAFTRQQEKQDRKSSHSVVAAGGH